MAIVVLGVAFGAGCGGGSADAPAVRKQAATLESVAAEGVLVADGVRDDDTLTSFVQVHADELASGAETVETALGPDAVTPPARRVAAQTRRLARMVAEDLRALADHPSDRARARVLRARLQHAASEAGDLGAAP